MDVQFDRCNVLDALLQYAGLQHLHYGPGDFPLSTALDIEHILATSYSDPYTTPTTTTSSILDMLVSLGHQGHAGHGNGSGHARPQRDHVFEDFLDILGMLDIGS